MSELDDAMDVIQQQIIKKALKMYSATVVEHWMRPRNQYAMDNPAGHAKVKGPCNDTIEIFIKASDGRITEASFLTDGCMTSIASGSMAVELANGMSVPEAGAMSQDDILDALQGLPEESLHCALLASNALRAAVDDYLLSEKEPRKKMYPTESR
jgi:nitrogen fixation protein NifU and related proteins